MKKNIFILIAFFIGIGAGVSLMYFISKNKTENNIPKENYSIDATKQTEDEASANRDNELKTTSKTVQYDNPIDEYYLPQINNIDKSMSETRALQYSYGYVWREEYKNIIKWIEDICDNTEKLQSVRKLDESI
ncbi:MAG: hypothetical protein IJ661_09280 [Lachnospiraceae bacterium]|nr:hypothetical protein [Lachnospiraceae bacterium]